MRLSQPQPEQARTIKEALERQENAKRGLLAAETPALLVSCAGEYLDATDALYETQLDVERAEIRTSQV